MIFKPVLYVITMLVIVAAGCGPNLTGQNAATATLYLITATLPPTLTPHPTEIPRPPTLVPTITPVAGTTTTQVNVRTQPSASSENLGTLGIFTKVQIIGKDPSGSWYQIIYAEGAEGKGWVTATYVQVEDGDEIPVVGAAADSGSGSGGSEASPTVETGAPTSFLPTLAPTLIAAPADGDSSQSPAVSVRFSPSTAQSFNYTSDVSAPEGDEEDWVQFTTYGRVGEATMVSVMIDCTGNSTLNVELWQNGVQLQAWEEVTCDQRSRLLLSLFAGSPYNLRLLAGSRNSGLNYVRYTLIVQAED